MMFDHVSLVVSDFAAIRKILAAAFEPLGIAILAEGDDWAMAGKPGNSKLWFGENAGKGGTIHLAFAADTREQVRQFHAAALAAGAVDNGAPGLRPQYSPTYYGAFVLDADGNNIEAVCRAAGE